MKCAVVYPSTPGLRQDSLVLTHALRESFPNMTMHSLELPTNSYKLDPFIHKNIESILPFDFAFFLERAYRRSIFKTYSKFARHTVYVPNIEWILESDKYTLCNLGINAVFLKNQFSADIFSKIQCASLGRNGKLIESTHVIGWSSLDIHQQGQEAHQDFDRALHVRGCAHQKQTEVLLDAWYAHPEFPKLTVVAWSRDQTMPFQENDLGNLTIRIRRLDEASLRRLQITNGIHIYPSLAEGFGHVLNEARAVSAVLITTDAPPMNDLVEDGVTGILVPVRSQHVRKFRGGPSWAFPVTPEDLAVAVKRVLQMSIDDRREMGQRARQAFLAERAAFVSRLKDAVLSL